MSDQLDGSSESGFGGRLKWVAGGALGGIVGSLVFGALLWLIDPEIVAGAIPTIYGFESAGAVGWGLHLVHGLILGVVFGFLVTRSPILGALMADVETGFIATLGHGARFALAGLVYGLAVWVVLPVIVLPIWLSLRGAGDPGFPVTALESLLGHLLFGVLLGALFSVFVETTPYARDSDAPFEEAPE